MGIAGLAALCALTLDAEQNVPLAWDPSPDTNVVGYALYYGTTSGSYGSRVDVGMNLNGTIPGLLEWQTYYFVAVAYNSQGVESPPSNEVNYRPVAGNNQILGRVIWGGQPLAGAHVWTTQGSAVDETWTASDGTYILKDLGSTNAYTVTCSATGLTFSAQFSNPVSLASGNAFGADFYANEPLPPSSGLTTYTVSGQVTDPVNGVAGVEVRLGGMTATTDTSGNYQFTNFVNGSYVATAQKDAWSFSPASRTVTVNSANSTGNNFARSAPYSISGNLNGLPAGSQSPAPTVFLSNGRFVVATKAGSGPNKYWTYTLNNVPAGQYSLGAELSGYSIVPSGFANPLNISGNLSSINFTGTVATVAGPISGRITLQGAALSGVSIAINQGATTVATGSSDTDGYFRIENLVNGAYSVVPSKTAYTFSPATASVSSVPASAINFSAAGPSAPSISSLSASPLVVPSANGTTTLAVGASGSGPLTYSWAALSSPAPVNFSVNDSSGAASTIVSFVAPGSYTFRARVTATNGLSASSNIVVSVNASPGAMVLTPYQAQAAGGQTIAFQAAAWDQLGNPITVTPNWSVSGGGNIDSQGRFQATTMGGPFTVTATAGSLVATSQVTVTSTSTNVPPTITTQPQSLTNGVGTAATFSVAASGSGPLNYQWQLNGVDRAGATGTSLGLSSVQPNDAGNYRVVVSNSAGAITSSIATLTVLSPPAITSQPQSQTNVAGTIATFTAGATGTAPLVCQWQFNSSTIAGATSAALTLTNVQNANAGNYSVVITNNAGSVTSSVATLTVLVPPAITTQPLSQTNIAGTVATFTVAATGTAPLVCQWQLNGGTIAGATSGALILTNLQTGNAGSYNVVITNSAGATTSAVAVLTVLVPPSIAGQPQTQTVAVGATANFTVLAEGTAPLRYQWLFNGAPIPGASDSTYVRTNLQTADAGNYSVQVTNLAGTATSSNALLTILQAPQITNQPLSRAVAAGSDVTFTVAVTGTGPFVYQWKFNGADITGATTNVYTRTNVQSADAGRFTVTVTNTAGGVTSDEAILTVNNPPVLSPIFNQTVHAGGTVTVANVATDTDTPSQILSYSLDAGCPPAATIGTDSGVLTWRTTLADAGTTNTLTVRVADNGSPVLSDARNFIVTVVPPLTVKSLTASNGIITISWQAIPGKTYRVEYEDRLNGSTWTALGADVVAGGVIGLKNDPIGPGPRFYRVRSLD